MESSQDFYPPPPNQGLPVVVIEAEQGYWLTWALRLAASATLTIAVVIFCLQGYYNKNRDRQYELQILLILLGASGSITADLIVAKIRSNQLRLLNATALRDQEMEAEVRRKISRDDFLGMVEQVKVVSLTLREEGVDPEVRRVMLSQLEERYLPSSTPSSARDIRDNVDSSETFSQDSTSDDGPEQQTNLPTDESKAMLLPGSAATMGNESTDEIIDSNFDSDVDVDQFRLDSLLCLDTVDQVVFSTDGQLAVTGEKGGIARLWDLWDLVDSKDRQLAEFKREHGEITQVVFSSDGQLFAISWQDGVIRVYDITGRLVAELTGQQGDVTQMVFSPYAHLLAVTGQEGTSLRFWDASGEELVQLQGKDITKMSFNDHVIAVNDMNGHVLISDPLERISVELSVGDKEITHMVFSPNGRQLVVIEQDGNPRLWDIVLQDMSTLRGDFAERLSGLSRIRRDAGLSTNRGNMGYPTNAVFDPSGESLATTYQDGTAYIWSIGGSLSRVLGGHGVPVNDVVFSPDHCRLAITYQDGTARLWDRYSGRQSELDLHEGDVTNVVFSSDGRMLATTHQDGTAHLYTSSPWQIELDGEKGAIANVVFSPDGRMLATTHQDGTAYLWDTRGSQPVELEVELGGDKVPMTNVVFSPNGRMLASTIHDKVYVFSIKMKSLSV